LKTTHGVGLHGQIAFARTGGQYGTLAHRRQGDKLT
jgi:hypothetical protein